MVYFLNEQFGRHEEELVPNRNTHEELLIRKEKSWRTGDYISIEIKRGSKKTGSKTETGAGRNVSEM